MKRDRFLNPNKNLSNAHVRSASQEKSLAVRGRGLLVHRSGAGGFDKGDVRGYKNLFTIEAKTTSAKSFSVNRDMLTKLEDAACSRSELPLLVVEFLDKSGDPEVELAILPMYALDTLLDSQRE